MIWLLTLLLWDCRSYSAGREHRAGKKIPLPGRSRYERVLSGISACMTKVHSIRMPSGAIPQRTADLSRPWYQLSNAISTVTVEVSVKQRQGGHPAASINRKTNVFAQKVQ